MSGCELLTHEQSYERTTIMPSLRIALAQCRQTADLDVNARTILRFLDRAAESGAKIVCFPETQTVGYRVDIATPETPVEPQRLNELSASG